MEGASDATWERLTEHAQFLRKLARALVADPTLAEDIEQATWIAASKRSPVEPDGTRGWLRRVAANVVRQWRRSNVRRERRELALGVPADVPSAADSAEQIEAQRIVLEAVRGLDPKYRTVVVLRFYEDLPAALIAARLDLPVATVRTQLQRAIHLLRDELDRRFDQRRERWQRALAPLVASGVRRASIATMLVAAAVLVVAVVVARWRVPARSDGGTTAAARAPAAGQTPRVSDSVPAAASPTVRSQIEARSAESKGCVVDSMARPIAGATVDLFAAFDDRRLGIAPIFTTTTDALGEFELPGSEPGGWTLFVRRTGFTTVHESIDRCWGSRSWLAYSCVACTGRTIRLEPARSCSGMVLDEGGRPIPNADVIGFDEPRINDFVQAETTTGDDGRFTLDAVSCALLRIGVVARGFEAAQVDETEDGAPLVVRMTARASATLDVTALDADDSPLADASIDVSSEDESPGTSGFTSEVRLPERFEKRTLPPDAHLVRDDVPPGRYRVDVWSRTGSFHVPTAKVVAVAGGRSTLVMRAKPRAAPWSVRGVLRDGAGRGLANRTVALAAVGSDRAATVTTDDGGRFERSMAGTRIRAWLVDPSETLVGAGVGDGSLIATAAMATALELTADRSASIRGRLVTEGSNPCPHREVAVVAANAPDEGAIATAWSDREGRFEFDGLPAAGSVRLRVQVGGQTVKDPLRHELTAGGRIDDVSIVIPDPGVLTGRVVDATSSPVVGAIVECATAASATGSGSFTMIDAGPPRTAVTDRDGAFRFDGLERGDYGLAARKRDRGGPASERTPVTIARSRPTAPVELILPQRRSPTSIDVRIVFADGLPHPDEVITVCCSSSGNSEMSSSTDRRFEFTGRVDATYHLEAFVSERKKPGTIGVATNSRSRPIDVRPGAEEIVIEIPDPARSASIAAEFRDPSGKPLDEIDWAVSAAGDPVLDAGSFQSLALDAGHFKLRGLLAGDYRIAFSSGGEPVLRRVVSVPATGSVDLGLIAVSTSRPRMRGVVVDDSGIPIEGAGILTDAAEIQISRAVRDFTPAAGALGTTTDRNGEFELDAGARVIGIWKVGFAPRSLRPSPPERGQPWNLRVVLLKGGGLELIDLPDEIVKARNWMLWLESADESTRRCGYFDDPASCASIEARKLGAYHLPVGRHIVHFWSATAPGSDGVSPPPQTAPHLCYAWTVEVRPDEIATIDVGKEW